MSKYSKIIGTGSYLPKRTLTNTDLERMVDTDNEWIVERTGIENRHLVDNETVLDMAYNSAIKAIEAANIAVTDIELIIVATSTQDSVMPSTACYLQERLGIKVAKGAFDMQAACSGFVYALSVADSMIKNNLAKNALIIGVDAMSRIIDYTDRGTCILFGDGAGAVVLSASDEPGVLASRIYSDGSYTSILNCDANITAGKVNGNPYLQMDGQAVFKFAVKALTKVAKELVSDAGCNLEDIDWIVPHQANTRILEAVSKTLDFPVEKVIQTVKYHGNTSAASIPLALDTAVKDNTIKHGDLLLLKGVGAGFTWGGLLVRF
jgi:3-oxoacyl-[acyl-carrier-protein] synthase-3